MGGVARLIQGMTCLSQSRGSGSMPPRKLKIRPSGIESGSDFSCRPPSRKFLRFRLSKLNLRMVLAVTINIIFVDSCIRVTALLGYINLDSVDQLFGVMQSAQLIKDSYR